MCLPRAVRASALVLMVLVMLSLPGCSGARHKGEDAIIVGNESCPLKNDIKTYLLLGVDTEKSLREEKEPGLGGQSDAIYLLVCDMSKKSVHIVGIPRDTMTEIKVFLPSGKYNGVSKDHLTLQYAFGDGMEFSCQLMEEAVSKLLYGIPIDGYAALNLGAVPDLADALNGVEVIVPDDSAVSEESTFKKGAKITLTRHNIKKFLRFRDIETTLSASIRMERHKAFFRGCAKKLKSMAEEDAASVIRLYETYSSEFITDMEPEECAGLARFDFEEDVELIPGKYNSDADFDEFYVDETALRKMVKRIFCE